eukprot:GHVU01200485.1.p1 GENE.GHVU01200485.1~~GHVU01200485.1.p1  ORF type:complete len:126 (-),score=14.46 GHVU01200485.1:615-992(-)
MTLARIRELNAGRTTGEWVRDSFGIEAGCDYLIGPDREGGLRFNSDHANLELDLNFIANAPAMIEYLLGLIDQAGITDPQPPVAAVRNPATGSYTVPVPQSARTGKMLDERPTVTGEIITHKEEA